MAIVSLGGARPVVFRSKADKRVEFSYALDSGSLLYMPQAIQHEWLHAIPKSPGAGERISLTFRSIVKAPHATVLARLRALGSTGLPR